jgi:tRNA modification GTPase
MAPGRAAVVVNKTDVLQLELFNLKGFSHLPAVYVSARTGAGIDSLVADITRMADAFQPSGQSETIAINARHADALGRARAALRAGLDNLSVSGPAELLASDLRGTLAAYGDILGKVDNERMLDQLFATFCIGK